MKYSLLITVASIATSAAFSPMPHSQSRPLSSSLCMAKGFGKTPEPKPKTQNQIEQEERNKKYDQVAVSGQEYMMYFRKFGDDDSKWLPCGAVAVPRGEQVANAIFSNEENLKKSIMKIYPKYEGEDLEYGFNLKIYPDDPIEVAVKNTKKEGLNFGNWVSNLLSPMDVSGMKKE